MEITEKVAYLKGLAEGMELNAEKKEGKLLLAIIDVLEDIALELSDIEDAQEELGEGLDAVSDDLEIWPGTVPEGVRQLHQGLHGERADGPQPHHDAVH